MSSPPNLDALVARAQRAARLPDSGSTLTWLRAVASLLADWGGRSASRALQESLPRELFSGRGSSGRSHSAALKEAGAGSEAVVLHIEAGRRAGEADPAKFAHALRSILGVLKQELGATRSEAVASALPPAAASELRSSSADASYGYRLVPQSYARPATPKAH